jgi:hypothetical protein
LRKGRLFGPPFFRSGDSSDGKLFSSGRLFGVAHQPGFVDVLVGQADVLDGWLRRDLLVWKVPLALSAVSLNLVPLLRRVVFLGEAAGGLGREEDPRL